MNLTNFLRLAAFALVAAFTGAQAATPAPAPPAKPPPPPVVIFTTSMGEIDVQLDPDHSPITTANFLAYVDKKFYDGTIFHRLIRGFIAQGGGFMPGMVEKKPLFPPIKNESDNDVINYNCRLAMARGADPNSATSQFFFDIGDHQDLDPSTHGLGYTVFGVITKGIEVLYKMSDVPTATVGQYENVPVTPIVLISVTRAPVK